ncbi:MAG: hypothetical protein HYX51_04285 [Chloroflexi bacterium]|nr:hypothetical protein [Chloroflexota bacterium]
MDAEPARPRTGDGHYCLITAIDVMNNVVVTPCQFTTLARFVSVTFDQTMVVDDSDDLSSGDLDFLFFINKKQVDKASFQDDFLKSGFGFQGPGPFNVSPPGNAVTLTVFGQDDDEDAWDICSDVFSNVSSIQGSDDCADWSTVEQTFTYPTGPGEVWSTSVNMKTYNGNAVTSPLVFEVAVTVSVTYK